MKSFSALLDEYFGFLVTQYDFEIVEEKCTLQYCVRIYLNAHIAININWDERDASLGIGFLPSSDKDRYELCKASNWMPFWPLYKLNGENYKPIHFKSMEKDIHAQSELLQRYGDRVLAGDFAVIPEMFKIICQYNKERMHGELDVQIRDIKNKFK